MNLESLYKWVGGFVIATALAGHLGNLQSWVWKAQARILYDSRSSAWGSPRFFGASNPARSKPDLLNESLKKNVITTTGRRIQYESRSN